MQFSINKKTIKKMLEEPGHTVLEYNLMRTALNAMYACSKKEHEANQYKQHLARIYGGILKQFPWIKEIHDKNVFDTKQDILAKASSIEEENKETKTAD